MSGRGDQQVDIAVARVLEKGPADVLEILDVLRRVRPQLLEGQEGSIHGFLHSRLRRGALRLAGRSPAGLVRYATTGDASAASSGSSDNLPALSEAVSRRALSVVKAVRDEADRGRVLADVVAHLTALGEEKRKAFGPPKRARQLLMRGDRGKRTVFFSGDAGDAFRRFLFHEGPWILGAVLLFFVVKLFIAEVYQIPSESMRPSLEVGDRVIVSRIAGAPERWDMVVFQHGNKAVVKRLAGLGGEEIALWQGDVYIDGKISPKPAELNEVVRHPLYRGALKDGVLPGWDKSQAEGSPVEWWSHMSPEDWSGERDFHGEVVPQPLPLFDGYLSVRANRPAGGVVLIQLRRGLLKTEGYEGAKEWTLEVRDTGVFVAELEPESKGEPVYIGSGPKIAPGPIQLSLSYIDGVLSARAGSWSWSEARTAAYFPLAPHVGTSGGAAIDTVAVDADLHYSYVGEGLVLAIPTAADQAAGRMNPHPIPPGHLFFLGDNSRDSKDSRSRDLGDVPASAVVGPVGPRIWPFGRIGSPR